jgi:ribonucleoside-diphosphate reductase alpha chain
MVDYVFRVLALEYLGMTEFAQVKPADGYLATPRVAGRETTSIKVPAIEAPVTKASPNETDAHADHDGEGPDLFDGEEQTLSRHLSTMMGDAPFCNICGHVTVRNGVCYKCLNCGNSMGCS